MVLVIDVSNGCVASRRISTECSSCGRLVQFVVGCDSRFKVQCPVCSHKWMRKVRNRFVQALENMDNPKMMTLTLEKLKKGSSELKRDDIKDIWKMKNRLFHYMAYRGYHVWSWFAVVEFPNHLHLVFDGDYIPQSELSDMWEKASKGSFIVDVRAVKRMRGGYVAHYLTKYLTKSAVNVDVDIDRLKSFRLIGSWHIVYQRHRYSCECGSGHLILIDELDFERRAYWEECSSCADAG